MQTFKTAGNNLCLGQTTNLLTACLYKRSHVESTKKEKKEIALERMDSTNDAIQVLSKLDSKEEFLLAFSWASIQAGYVSNLSEGEEGRKNIANRAVSYAESAIALSKEIDKLCFIQALCTFVKK